MSDQPQMFVPYQQKTETRRGGRFEDVTRPNQQTFMHGAMRFAQIGLTLLALFAWAKVAEAYDQEMVTGRLADLLSAGILVLTLILVGLTYAIFRARTHADKTWTGFVIIGLLAVWVGFNAVITPVLVFSLVMIEHNLLYMLPIIITAAAAAFVPSLEVGRFSFWRELVDQNGANSEKPVLDETQIQIKQMQINWEREQSEAREAELKAEIDRLKTMITTPHSQVIDPEPAFGRRKSIEDCIQRVKMNGHWQYQASTRNGPRRLDATLLLEFIIEAWAKNKFDRRYWIERNLKRDDWEAMRSAVAWAVEDSGRVIRGVDDVIAEMVRMGVITTVLYPPAPPENGLSQSRPLVNQSGTGTEAVNPGVGGSDEQHK